MARRPRRYLWDVEPVDLEGERIATGRHCFGCLERGARVVGLDLDRDSLHAAARPLRNRGRDLGRMAEMIHGNAFRLPFQNETFDRVICSEVMEHVHDYRGAARELARVTRPEGWVAVVKPGRIMFELEGVPEDVAKRAMELAAAKLPIKCKIEENFEFDYEAFSKMNFKQVYEEVEVEVEGEEGEEGETTEESSEEGGE